MHRLSSSFVLGYHGCDQSVGEALLRGEPFRISNNDYDWLGPGVYFWEANPERGLAWISRLLAESTNFRLLTKAHSPSVIEAAGSFRATVPTETVDILIAL